MLFRIKYTTRYRYEKPACESRNQVRLAPIDAPDQRRIAFALKVVPAAAIREFRDDFGNLGHAIDVLPPHTELTISAESTVERLELPAAAAERVSIREYLAGDSLRMDRYRDFLSPSRYVPASTRLRKFF